MPRLTPPRPQNDDDAACRSCHGDGVETYFVGTYGTSSCLGPAERICPDCNGTGVR